MKPLVIIPARGGSKGVPRKNIKILNGKPLIQFTIEAAQNVFDNSLICLTTDDQEIKNTAENLGLMVPFLRPESLATDTSGTYEVLLHAISFYENKGYNPDVIIVLQPTSPFRNSKHIKEALALYTENLDMVVSVKLTSSNPYYVLFEENESGYLNKSKEGNFQRRQDCPSVWEFNGAIYIINVNSLKSNPINSFKKIIKYQMDDFESHDIDTDFDFNFAEYLCQINKVK